MHGSFEFPGNHNDIEDGFYWSYEARFTRRDLDTIVFLGEWGGAEPSDYNPDEPTRIQFLAPSLSRIPQDPLHRRRQPLSVSRKY